ncbi:PREDICTED: RNA polymerase II transcriptional coactivator KIWI-like [Acropora digitifera]|uniref:RNA polymerase II transcriptional coactivator KIWI-like n=1 Tax=Acropora digitifera TaxID=70779 RepID=UPI00077AD6A3|nr:PREDICTED: RNA polymerase II transcriptional coactivator KIWI-like [Acropora digitifera]
MHEKLCKLSWKKMSKKVKSKATVTDSSEESDKEEVKTKKKKTADEKSSSSKGEDNFSFPLADRRKISVREFKGKVYVDIREFYESDGELKPGKKGIMLQISQWEKLKEHIDDVDEAIKQIS